MCLRLSGSSELFLSLRFAIPGHCRSPPSHLIGLLGRVPCCAARITGLVTAGPSLCFLQAELLGDDGVSMSLLEHAFQTAEKLRAAYPQEDWLHLSGLIHGLGKLLAHEE